MSDPNQPEQYRLRLLFAKKRDIKYISHLDLSLAWERALRRAQIPLRYSQGFNPRPKMQFASGLPLGSTSSCEILDIYIDQPLTPEDALTQIRPKLPLGIKLLAVASVPVKEPTLQNLLRQAEYRVLVEIDLPPETLQQRVDEILAADELIETRRRRKRRETYNMRPLLEDLRLVAVDDGDAELWMRVAAGQHGNLRPESVLKALGLADNWAEIERTRLIFDDEAEVLLPQAGG